MSKFSRVTPDTDSLSLFSLFAGLMRLQPSDSSMQLATINIRIKNKNRLQVKEQLN
jgi:hypothetical protein